MRVPCLPAALLAVAVLAHTEKPGATAADVVELVTISLALDRDDAKLARQLKKLRPAQKLSDESVGFLATQEIGPEALSALEEIAKKSATLAIPAQEPIETSVPPAEDRQRMLTATMDYVAHYVHGLPDFTCDEITRRFSNLVGTKNPGAYYADHLHRIDTLQEQLRFTGAHDRGTLVAVNGKAARHIALTAGQSITTGEFGEDMRMVLGPASGAIIRWDRWQTLHGRRAAVFSYVLGLRETHFQIMYCCIEKAPGIEVRQTINSAIQGLLYTDVETGAILRMTIQAMNLPGVFLVKESRTLIDYGPVVIADRAYILPLRASIYIRSGLDQRTLNNIEFTNYKKFDAQSVLLFTDSKISYGKEVPDSK